MTDDVLSQDEVDALLNGIEENSIDNAPPAAEAGEGNDVKSLDFGNQERIVRSQFPVLERIHERLSKKLAVSIYDRMSRDVEVSMVDMKILKFSEFMLTLLMPTAINSIKIHPLRGKALVVMDQHLIYSLVENYFGGSGKYPLQIEDREFTLTEQRIGQVLLELVFEDLKEAWSPIMEVNFDTLSFEMNPQLVTLGGPNDIILITPFDIQFENSGGRLFVALPHSMLEPIREQLDLGAARSDDEIDPMWIGSLREEIMDAELQLSSVLANATLSLQELMKLKDGDIIPLEIPETVVMNIERIPSYVSKFGISKDKLALKILQFYER